MKIAIMQPYLFPYIGYFQLMKSVDQFVVYDNIQFTKKGWINRNRILVNGQDHYLSLPLKKDSDRLNINQRFLSDEFDKEKLKILNKIKGVYGKAPHFKSVLVLIEEILNFQDNNLFDFIYNSLEFIKEFLDIKCTLIKSSELNFNIEDFKGQDKVIAICNQLNTNTYINPIGGMSLYSKEIFKENDIVLNFIKSYEIEYQQYKNDFVPWLSIIDVLMFNSVEDIKKMLIQYELI